MRGIASGCRVVMLLVGATWVPAAGAQGGSTRRIDVCVVADG